MNSSVRVDVSVNNETVLLSQHTATWLNEHITIVELSKLLNVNEKTIKRDISSLCEKGLLTREGSDRMERWVVNYNSMEE